VRDRVGAPRWASRAHAFHRAWRTTFTPGCVRSSSSCGSSPRFSIRSETTSPIPSLPADRRLMGNRHRAMPHWAQSGRLGLDLTAHAPIELGNHTSNARALRFWNVSERGGV